MNSISRGGRRAHYRGERIAHSVSPVRTSFRGWPHEFPDILFARGVVDLLVGNVEAVTLGLGYIQDFVDQGR